MRIYLLRHAEPSFRGGIYRCLGTGENPGLSPQGILQTEGPAEKLSDVLEKCSCIYTSPLKRAWETAENLADRTNIRCGITLRLITCEGLKEMDAGLWDGLDFDTIREKYREAWEARGKDPSLPPPGGETYEHAARRMEIAVKSIAAEEERKGNDAAVAVAHAGVNRALLCRLLSKDYSLLRELSQGYACVNELYYDSADNSLKVLKIGG